MCTFKIIAVSNWELYRKFHGKEEIEAYMEYLAGIAGAGREKKDNFRQRKDSRNFIYGLQSPDVLIVREKEMKEEKYLEFFDSLWKKCGCSKEQEETARIVPHTYLSAAFQTGSSSIHLPLHLLNAYQKEKRLAGIKRIGVSVHSLEEAKEAEQLGASYLTAGHVFATDCKKGLLPRGLEFLEEICDNVTIPVYAIGGIHADNLSQIRQTKAAGACMMSEYMRG